jgi:hypothetical protein
LYRYNQLSAQEWIKGLSRIQAREDLPITISGGEPTLHKKFFDIANGVGKPMDLLSNGNFNVSEFIYKINTSVFNRGAKYASIRLSYHPNNTKLWSLLRCAWLLNNMGYSVGVWAVKHPDYKLRIYLVRLLFNLFGIDFRAKEFLTGSLGTYKYPEGLDGKEKKCLCKPSELLIAPDGRLFRCHHDLYHGVNSYGNILDEKVKLPTKFAVCYNYGRCSPCDLKIKYDRFQEKGHCSVEIKKLG